MGDVRLSRRGLWVVAAALAMAGAVGCSGGGEAEPASAVDTAVAPGGPSTTSAPTTTAVPTTTTPGAAEAALPVAGIDFDELYRALDAVREEAFHTENAELYATVDAEASLIEGIRADAADTATSWDFSEQTYTVQSVEVFRVVDENRVLLTVVDEVTGKRYRRDATGAVLEEVSRDPYPVRQFLVLLDRTSGRWLISYDALSAPVEFPMPRFDDFAPAGAVDVGDGQTVSFAQSRPAGSTLGCFLVRFPDDPVPHIGCQQLPDYKETAVMLLFRSSDGAHEALVALQGFRTEGAAAEIAPGKAVPLDQPIGTWFYGVTADKAGVMESLTWGGSLGDNNGPTPLDDLRADLRPGEAAAAT